MIYLIFNEGYAAQRRATTSCAPTLSGEAIRLGGVLCALMPDEPEVAGPGALMLLQDSRRGARLGADGRLVAARRAGPRPLGRARRSSEGAALLERALRHRRPGPLPAPGGDRRAPRRGADGADTDWPQIAALYGELARLHPTPVVALNRAVAVAMADGPQAGLRELDAPRPGAALDGYLPFHAARAELLRRAGRPAEAAAAYAGPRGLAATAAERRFLDGAPGRARR